MTSTISPEIRNQLLIFQRNEITEHYIYRKLAQTISSPENKEILIRIAEDERRYYDDWKKYTATSPGPDHLKIWFYFWIARILGLTFGIKLMERGEEAAQKKYAAIFETIPEAEKIAREENDHENALIELLDEERLQYTGSIVLGLNDALVELTGALAGLTLALQNTRLIALTGLITGIAYVVTVFILILPYLLLNNYFTCLFLTLFSAILIIAFFNYYISVAKDLPFRPRFFEMAGLSLGVAGLSFLIGWVIRFFIGVDV